MKGRRALVTGSVTGIGRAISEDLAAAGAAVVAHGLEGEQVSQTAAAWRARGFAVAESIADLAQAEGPARLERDIAAWGRPDILVLNASVEIPMTWQEVDLAAMQTQWAINVQASILLIQRFLPHMIEQGWGRVLALGSVQEDRPNAHHLIYAATKAAQTSAILNLARTVRAPGVTFNVLKPGAIETDRNRARLAEPKTRSDVVGRIPLARLGAPEDCVAAARLLCSEEGGYINGAELHVDGGLRL